MTREVGQKDYDDLKPSLQKRVDLANSLDADLFVSIHHNSSTSQAASGVEVYYSSETPLSGNPDLNKVDTSKTLAEAMVNNLAQNIGQNNRGAKDDDFFVVKNTLMPSVLVETGFITNPQEAQKISNGDTQQLIAIQLANAIDGIF